jgi:hypothetical protein
MLVSLAMLESVISETRSSVPGRPGRVSRYDVVSNREGVRQLFLMFEPLRGWRHVVIRRTKAAVDWAEVIADLLENQYPDVGRVRLVMDNLNTHAGGSLYQAFPAEQARELYQRLEIHYTPKQLYGFPLSRQIPSLIRRKGRPRTGVRSGWAGNARGSVARGRSVGSCLGRRRRTPTAARKQLFRVAAGTGRLRSRTVARRNTATAAIGACHAPDIPPLPPTGHSKRQAHACASPR